MLEEPRFSDTRPIAVRLGRALSSLPVFAWPFGMIAAWVSLRAAPEGALRACVASWWGAFQCTGIAYPVVMGLAFTASHLALRRARRGWAGVAAWLPLVLLLTPLLLSARLAPLVSSILGGPDASP